MLEHTIDLFLIDIILDATVPGDTSGLYLAEKIRMISKYKFTPMIFITSLVDSKCLSYATFHCYSYIEKPFDPVYVKNVVAECLEFPKCQDENKILFFRKDGIVLAVNREDIVYVETISHVLHIYTVKGDVLKIPYITLKRFLEMADSDKFIRCRRNIIVHQKYMELIDLVNGVMLLSNGQSVDVGLTYKNAMRKLYDDTRADLHN